MARTPAVAALAELAGACAGELGFAVADVATGGISYANVLAALGLPVLDGLGPVGGRDHSPHEYILVSSVVPRTALLALLLLRRAQRHRADDRYRDVPLRRPRGSVGAGPPDGRPSGTRRAFPGAPPQDPPPSH